MAFIHPVQAGGTSTAMRVGRGAMMQDLPEPKSGDGCVSMSPPPHDDVRRAAVHSGHYQATGFISRSSAGATAVIPARRRAARVRAEKTTVLPPRVATPGQMTGPSQQRAASAPEG